METLAAIGPRRLWCSKISSFVNIQTSQLTCSSHTLNYTIFSDPTWNLHHMKDLFLLASLLLIVLLCPRNHWCLWIQFVTGGKIYFRTGTAGDTDSLGEGWRLADGSLDSVSIDITVIVGVKDFRIYIKTGLFNALFYWTSDFSFRLTSVIILINYYKRF